MQVRPKMTEKSILIPKDEKELMTIPGVGPSKAAAIVQYRTDHGDFKSPESLMEVSGIGQKTFEKLESQITVN